MDGRAGGDALAKLAQYAPGLVIFTYKKTAAVLFGQFVGNGFVPTLRLGASPVFVMPGPYERTASAAPTMRALADRFMGSGDAGSGLGAFGARVPISHEDFFGVCAGA